MEKNMLIWFLLIRNLGKLKHFEFYLCLSYEVWGYNINEWDK